MYITISQAAYMILDRILEVSNNYEAKIYCDDIEMYFDDEQAIIDCLVDNFPDKYDEDDDE